jgi:NCAIR mutase (PurE)-related protein
MGNTVDGCMTSAWPDSTDCSANAPPRGARVIIVVPGWRARLPSVVAGLVSAPVIAVPDSVGYGASFGGARGSSGMLNSCASACLVVNIDNGSGGQHRES